MTLSVDGAIAGAARAQRSLVQFCEEQEEALRLIDEWLDQPEALVKHRQLFNLFGYAGTGKTTLAAEVADRHPGAVCAAYTGKAALVLSQKLGRPASTIHSLIYTPDPCSGPLPGEATCPHGRTREHIEWTDSVNSPLRTASYLILDECSMVTRKIAMDLLWFNKPILVLGDPAQLPPMRDGQDDEEGPGYFTMAVPDVKLTQVHRHKDDGGILELATDVRLGRSIKSKPQVLYEHLPAVLDERMPDIIITGFNKTRMAANTLVRARLGHTDELPRPGEPLLCLQNNSKLDLLNGQILTTILSKPLNPREYAVTAKDPYTGQVYTLLTALRRDLSREQVRNLKYSREHARFAFGYAITTHKAQGSQWDDVVIVDEWSSRSEDYDKWLYTATTRAVHNLRVLRKPPPLVLQDPYATPTLEELEFHRRRQLWPL